MTSNLVTGGSWRKARSEIPNGSATTLSCPWSTFKACRSSAFASATARPNPSRTFRTSVRLLLPWDLDGTRSRRLAPHAPRSQHTGTLLRRIESPLVRARRTSPGVGTYDPWALPTAKPDKWFPYLRLWGREVARWFRCSLSVADPFDSKGISRSRLLIASKIAVEFKPKKKLSSFEDM